MMFGRLLWNSLREGRGRLAVALVALVSGAAVSSALLNLQFDAERKFTREFRTLGANLVVTAPVTASAEEGSFATFGPEEFDKIRAARPPERARVAAMAPFLYVLARAGKNTPLIAAGTDLSEVRRLAPWWTLEGEWITSAEDRQDCLVGRSVAAQLKLELGSSIELRYAGRSSLLKVAGIVTAGGAEDSQVIVNLPVAQELAGLPGRIGMVQISATGTPEEIQEFSDRLAAAVPGLEVRPIRQIAQAEGQLLGRLGTLLLTTVGIVLLLTALCVLAAMATLAMERRTDVGLMKALGGPMSRIVRLFLAEVGLLGAVGGALGSLVGAVLSAWIGRRVFGTAISPRFDVFPLTIALMVGVALAGALPLRLLGRVRPAVVLRGE